MTGTLRPGWRLACVAVLAALPLSACAAGYQAETSRERTTLTSVSGAKGDLTLRNVYLLGPATAGGSLSLQLAIFNGGTLSDRLLSISSPRATSATAPRNAALPGGGRLVYNLGDSNAPTLTGLKSDAPVGQTLSVILTFAQAGELTMTVPIESEAQVLGVSPTPAPVAATSTAAARPER